ncbi:hypothetical protein ADL27_11265, partial [Streptomyces sp. NRRL F-6602]
MSAPTPEPLTPERLREIADRRAHALALPRIVSVEAEKLIGTDVPDLLAEVTRLRAALSAAADDVNELTGEIGGWSAKNAALRAERSELNKMVRSSNQAAVTARAELRQRPSRAEVLEEAAQF